jgi:hypothetical protein
MAKTRARIVVASAGNKKQNNIDKDQVEVEPDATVAAKRQKIEETEKSDPTKVQLEVKKVLHKSRSKKAVVAKLVVVNESVSNNNIEQQSGTDRESGHDVKPVIAEVYSSPTAENLTKSGSQELTKKTAKYAKKCCGSKSQNVKGDIKDNTAVESNVIDDTIVKGKRVMRGKHSSNVLDADSMQGDGKSETIKAEKKKPLGRRRKHSEEVTTAELSESTEVTTESKPSSGNKFVGAHVSIAGE